MYYYAKIGRPLSGPWLKAWVRHIDIYWSQVNLDILGLVIPENYLYLDPPQKKLEVNFRMAEISSLGAKWLFSGTTH